MQLMSDRIIWDGHFDWLDISVVSAEREKQLGRLHCADVVNSVGWQPNQWHTVVLGELEVSRSTDVLIHLRNLESSFKSSMAWDGLCLVRLPMQ